MSLTDMIRGTGRRRRSTEQWDALEASLSKAQRAALVPGAVRCFCPARRHGDFWVYNATPLPCPWCAVGLEHEKTLEVLRVVGSLEIEVGLLEEHLKTERTNVRRLEQEAQTFWVLEGTKGPVSDPARMDIPGSCFARAEDEPVEVPSLTDAELGPRVVADTPPAPEPTPIVDLTAETLAVDVCDLRKAAGLGETKVIPVVTLPPDLEPAIVPQPATWPPVHMPAGLRTTWTGTTVKPLADALAAADLKDQASATGTLPIGTLAVQFAKAGATP